MSPTLTGYYRLQIEGAFTGPSILCSSETYSFQNAPPGATFNWSVSPLGIASPNPATGSSTTLIKTGNGNIILTAQVTNFCGADFTATKAIAVGSPQPGPITVVLVDYHIGRIQVQIDEVPGATSYNWYKDGVLQTIYHGTFAQIPITRNRCNVGYAIEVLAINACGTSARTYKGVYVPCDGGFKLSPNPTSNTVTVSVNENNESTNSGFDEVKIYDQQSNLKIYRRFNKVTSATIDVGSLFNGIYVVEISSGDYKERQQLIVQK
jgi:hypothetical protein